jgi:transposase-like protein
MGTWPSRPIITEYAPPPITLADVIDDKENIAPLPDARRLDDIQTSRELVDELVRVRVLLPLTRLCHTCEQHRLTPINDERYSEGIRLRCNHCTRDFSVRRGSIFEHSSLPLKTLIRLTHAYGAGVTVAKAAATCAVHRNTASAWYQHLRECCVEYMKRHPIIFPETEIVEVDELHLRCLQQKVALARAVTCEI